MGTYGQRLAQDALAGRLAAFFPNVTDLDMDVVAAELIRVCDLKAIAVVDEREAAFQAALKSLMDYYGSLLASHQTREAELEAERTRLYVQLAKQVTTATVPTSDEVNR